TVGLEEASSCKLQVTSYPNPAREVVYVEIASSCELRDASFELVDMYGKVIVKENLEPGKSVYEIIVRELPDGVYILWIMIKEQIVLEKVIVMH
ncbi:T9SS type A sorting domain-containing protein, partial [Bacteroidota bacterium]